MAMNINCRRKISTAPLRRTYYWIKSRSMKDSGNSDTNIHELAQLCFKKMHWVQERTSVTTINIITSHVCNALDRDVYA